MKSLKTLLVAAAWSLAAGAGSAPAAEEAAVLDGAMLYKTKGCLGCHGADGRTPIMPLYPKVTGQPADYVFNQMRDIKSGARSNGQTMVMRGIMATVSEEESRAIAEWLATQ